MNNLNQQILDVMLQNRRRVGEYQYTLPSEGSYPYQWLWDSCFHAIILTHFNNQDAKQELLSLVAKQFDNGMIPHMLYWQVDTKTNFPKIQWGMTDTSSITQPPMLAYAVWQIYNQDNDKQFLQQIYPNLIKFYNYLLSERDPRNNNLASIINPDESGEDNSPRFDIGLGLPPLHTSDENFQKRLKLIAANLECKFDAPLCMKNFFWIKDVPFNAILVENLKALSNIALELDNTNDADYFLHESETVKQAMRNMMLEDDIFWPIYWDTKTNTYQKIKVKTWAIFAPLFAQVATKQEADYIVTQYLKSTKEFNTPYPVPTVSQSEPSFDPQGFWRGPVWMSLNWFIVKGLKKYGYYDLSQKIINDSRSLLTNSGFREYYHPLTGQGLGAQNFTWGGLVIDM